MNIERRFPSVVISLLAVFVIGGCSGGSTSPPPPPPADTAAPTVSTVQAPTGAANRVVTLSLTASDNVGVTAVRFFVDGVLLGSDTSPPYTIDWDTTSEAEGDHSLTAEAEDAAGNVATSALATVTVKNMVQLNVAASGLEEVPLSDSQATAQATFMINLATGALQGSLIAVGITPTAAHIHDAFAGTNGPVLVPLDQDPVDPAILDRKSVV